MRWSFITDGNYINFRHTDETDLHIQQTIHRLHNTSRCIDWSLPADTTRITFTIDESKYENISIYDVDFDGVVMTVQSDFETNIKIVFPGLAGGSGYSVYTATLGQESALVAPTANVLENTLSGTPVWTRIGVGNYRATLNGAFPDFNKTLILPTNSSANIMGMGFNLPFDYGWATHWVDADTIGLSIYKTSDYSNAEMFDIASAGQIWIEARVYP